MAYESPLFDHEACDWNPCDMHLKSFPPTRCEYTGCKQRATQADTYLNSWFCDNHYSLIGRMTDDYQAPNINFNQLEELTV